MNQLENKFCFNQPITPTSDIGAGEGGILFFWTKASLDNLSHHYLKWSIIVINYWWN